MDFRAGWPARAVALVTVAYSVSITVAPRLLAKATGLTRPDGSVPEGVAGLIRSIGVRDATLAAALVAAPVGYPIALLTAARVLSDAADAVWFARIVDDRSAKLKVAGAAGGWAVLEAAVGMRGGSRSVRPLSRT